MKNKDFSICACGKFTVILLILLDILLAQLDIIAFLIQIFKSPF